MSHFGYNPTAEHTRQEMLDAIAAALLRFDASTRAFLLKIKRDCFNARPIAKYKDQSSWAELEKISPHLPRKIMGYEARLQDLEQRISDRYDLDYEKERRLVVSLTLDTRFLRGIALGRLGLVEKIRSRASTLMRADRLGKTQKWKSSLPPKQANISFN